eukprot:1140339-Pelagomonas_calceolata.AAC.6
MEPESLWHVQTHMQCQLDERGWPVHAGAIEVKQGQHLVLTTRTDVEASENVLPITYDGFADLSASSSSSSTRCSDAHPNLLCLVPGCQAAQEVEGLLSSSNSSSKCKFFSRPVLAQVPGLLVVTSMEDGILVLFLAFS